MSTKAGGRRLRDVLEDVDLDEYDTLQEAVGAAIGGFGYSRECRQCGALRRLASGSCVHCGSADLRPIKSG